MALVVAVVLAFLFLEEPWSWFLVLGGLGIEVGEAWLWWTWSRRRKPAVGAEALIGAEGLVVGPGQVRVAGELWGMRGEAAVGESVRITAVNGLLLTVERR